MSINQLRVKIGVMFGSPEATTGGNALKYYASVRLDIRLIGQVKVGDEVTGNWTRAKVVKNKQAPPFKSTEFDIRYGTGIGALGDPIDTAVDTGVLTKSGAHYGNAGKSRAQGRERAREALLADADTRVQIEQAVCAGSDFKGGAAAAKGKARGSSSKTGASPTMRRLMTGRGPVARYCPVMVGGAVCGGGFLELLGLEGPPQPHCRSQRRIGYSGLLNMDSSAPSGSAA